VSTSISTHSRLRFSPILTGDGIEFWDLLDLPVIPEQPDDISYTVQGFDRIDLLAEKFYGDAVLWWVIAVVNSLEVIPTSISVGQTLRIPSPRYVLRVLFQDALHRKK